jgi:hypothetical protein
MSVIETSMQKDYSTSKGDHYANDSFSSIFDTKNCNFKSAKREHFEPSNLIIVVLANILTIADRVRQVSLGMVQIFQ